MTDSDASVASAVSQGDISITKVPSSDSLPTAFCLKCQKVENVVDAKELITTNNRSRISGTCESCKKEVSRFLKSTAVPAAAPLEKDASSDIPKVKKEKKRKSAEIAKKPKEEAASPEKPKKQYKRKKSSEPSTAEASDSSASPEKKKKKRVIKLKSDVPLESK